MTYRKEIREMPDQETIVGGHMEQEGSSRVAPEATGSGFAFPPRAANESHWRALEEKVAQWDF